MKNQRVEIWPDEKILGERDEDCQPGTSGTSGGSGKGGTTDAVKNKKRKQQTGKKSDKSEAGLDTNAILMGQIGPKKIPLIPCAISISVLTELTVELKLVIEVPLCVSFLGTS